MHVLINETGSEIDIDLIDQNGHAYTLAFLKALRAMYPLDVILYDGVPVISLAVYRKYREQINIDKQVAS